MNNKSIECILHDRRIIREEKILIEGIGKTTVSVLGVVISIPTSGVSFGIYRSMTSLFGSTDKRCGMYAPNTRSRQACILNVKLEGVYKAIELANREDNKKLLVKATKKKMKYEKELVELRGALSLKNKEERTPTRSNKISVI
jgi:hypothetical protein